MRTNNKATDQDYRQNTMTGEQMQETDKPMKRKRLKYKQDIEQMKHYLFCAHRERLEHTGSGRKHYT